MPAPGAGRKYGGSKNRVIPELEKWTKLNHCTITIGNTDEICLARALVVGIAHAKWKAEPSDDTYKILVFHAKKLFQIVYKGPEANIKVFLYWLKAHFEPVTKLGSFFILKNIVYYVKKMVCATINVKISVLHVL
ncbi:hypothetical protein CHUAL_011996 [Chamberlinius hualienensis]